MLSPNENPGLYSAVANPVKEPNSSNFQLWVDCYDLVNCEEPDGKEVWVVATIGSNSSDKHIAKYKKQTKTYVWPKISIKAVSVNFPNDINQTPDIIINVYSKKTFSGEYRLGYTRISAKDVMRNNPSP